MNVATQRCAAGAVDHGGATRVQPAEKHHRAQAIARQARVDDDDLAQEPGCPAERRDKPPCPDVEPPREKVHDLRDSTRERARHPRNRCNRLAGRAAGDTPRRPSGRSTRQTPPLERRPGIVTGETTTGAESERARERATTAKARPKVHRVLYAPLAHAPASGLRTRSTTNGTSQPVSCPTASGPRSFRSGRPDVRLQSRRPRRGSHTRRCRTPTASWVLVNGPSARIAFLSRTRTERARRGGAS
jgi:hypothetical protein